MQNNNKKYLYFILGFIFILIVVFSFIYMYFITQPKEDKGKNYNMYELTFDVYVVNNLTSKLKVEEYFNESNSIWNEYNISTNIKSINNVNSNLSKEEMGFLFDYLSNDKNDLECNKYISIIDKITNGTSNLSAIFIDNGVSKNRGRGYICNRSFVMVDIYKPFFIDVTGIDLAHEIGHFLGLFDINGNQDLMNHNLFMKSFKSHFLNQDQIEKVSIRINEITTNKISPITLTKSVA